MIELPPLRIAIVGLGTVGVGVAEILSQNAAKIAARAGREIKLVAVCSRDTTKNRGYDLSGVEWVQDPIALTTNPEIDVIIELIGGSEGVAKNLCESALKNGKHVITANKALIANHGVQLAQIAEERGVQLQFEAAVAGGIPIIKLIKEGLAANDYQKLVGILNGTCNYILSVMEQTGRAFDDVLAEAQAMGYAEADPAFDIDGVDAAHKLCILSAIAFGTNLAFEEIYCEGIRDVSAEDIKAARELGYSIRLIAVTSVQNDKIELRVHPALLPIGTPISEVDGVYNAVHLFADAVGDVFIEGKGAGRYPTASAVIADIIDVARGNAMAPFLSRVAELKKPKIIHINEHQSPYYLRLNVSDNAGVLAAITHCFSEAGVSVARLIQAPEKAQNAAYITLTTHLTTEKNMKRAITMISELGNILRTPARLIRIEE